MGQAQVNKIGSTGFLLKCYNILQRVCIIHASHNVTQGIKQLIARDK